jgi:5S rRNA maturation endonuclease (ribonuclease M5)
LTSRKRRGWRHYLELEARLKEIIGKINYSVSAVIVEGKRDEEALRDAGLRSPAVQFSSSGLPVFAFVEEVVAGYRGSTVLVLLDFDEEGREMAERLAQELEEGGVRVEKTLRGEIAWLLIREGIMRVEEIHTIRRKASV